MADFDTDPYNLGSSPAPADTALANGLMREPASSPTVPDFDKDPYGLGAAPKISTTDPYGLVKQEKEKRGLIAELGQSIGQFVSDTAKAPITTVKAVNRDLLTFKSLVESTGYSNAARTWGNEFRAKMGMPVTPEEEQGLASSIAEFKRARPDDPWVKRAEENLKAVTVLSGPEKKEWDRGLGNVAALSAGGLIGKGVQGATAIIPNELARRIAAIEAHSIASMVSFDVAHSVAEQENITAQSLAQSAALGAVLPGVTKIAGKAAGGVIKGVGAAGQATVVPMVGSLDRALAHVKIYNAVRTGLEKLYDSSIISGEALLRKHGLGDTADRLVKIRGESHSLGAVWDTRVAAAMRGLSKEDRNLVGRLLHEDEITEALLAPAKDAAGVQRAVKEVSNTLTRVGSLAEQAKLVVGDSESGNLYRFVRRKDFGMPHVFVNTERFMEDGKLRNQALDAIKKTLTKEGWKPEVKGETLDSHATDVLERIHLRASGEYEEAVQKFGKKFTGTVQVWGRHYDLPGYHLDPTEVLPSYLFRMARNISQAKEFGGVGEAIVGRSPKDLYPEAFAALEGITDPATKNRLEAVITRQLGAGFKEPDVTTKRVLTSLQQIQAVTKLGLAQIAQASQLITPNFQTGFKDSMKDFFRLIRASPELEDQLARTGAFSSALVRAAEESMYGAGKEGVLPVSQVLRRTGFTGLDTFARKYGVLRGWSFASHQAEEAFRLTQRLRKAGGVERIYIEGKLKKIEAKLVDLGIDTAALYKRGGILTPEEFLKAGQRVSTDWNFWGDSLSLPVFWNSPAGKVLTQFKSFAFQQTHALNKHVVKPALDGDLQPLVRLLIAGQISGEIINDMRALARGKSRSEQKRIFDNYAALGLLSIWGDTTQAAQKKDWMAGFLAGPTGSDILEASTGISEAAQGKPKRLIKKTLQTVGPMVPGIGPLATPAVVNAIYPPKEQK